MYSIVTIPCHTSRKTHEKVLLGARIDHTSSDPVGAQNGEKSDVLEVVTVDSEVKTVTSQDGFHLSDTYRACVERGKPYGGRYGHPMLTRERFNFTSSLDTDNNAE